MLTRDRGERGRKRGKGEAHTVESMFSLPVSPSSMPCACTRGKVFGRAPHVDQGQGGEGVEKGERGRGTP